MDCKICAKLMDDYVEHTLSGDMASMFDEHVDSCNPCRTALEQLKRFTASLTSTLATTTGMLKLRPEMEGDILSALDEEERIIRYHGMMELFETLTFREKWAKVLAGLKMSPETGEHKWARLQMTRLWSTASAVVVPIVILALLAVLATLTPKRANQVEIRIAEVEQPDELEEPEDIPEPEIEPPDPEQIIEPTENFIPSTSDNVAAPDTDFSPQPAQFDAVAIVKSPVMMKGIFGSRSPGARGSALGKYGGGGHTEGAVLRALRWLKKYQEEDGSWRGSSGNNTLGDTAFPEALTGLGLLTFLAHGETTSSPEFGKTVEKAIKFLLSAQREDGFYKQTGGSMDYTHPIATYALCEAYGLTKLPSVKAAAEKAVDFMIKGQHADGGWDYSCRLDRPRIDVSICSWCVQALKAAKMGGLKRPGLEEALKKAKDAFAKVLFIEKTGVFKYSNTGKYENQFKGLTGAAVLSLQLMGQAECGEARKGLEWLNGNASCDWEKPWGESPIYFWYYITQAKFHTGGAVWREWNKQFSFQLVKNQTVEKGAGDGGKDIGYWTLPKKGGYDGKSFVYATTLCALQLQVYYRYLPTFQKAEDIVAENKEADAQIVEAQDLDIEVEL